MSFQLPAFQMDAFQAPLVQQAVTAGITDLYEFDPALDDAFDEAFERAGIDPLAIGHPHIESALRSCRYMLNSEWSTMGIRQWMIVQETHTTAVGEASFVLPAGTLGVFHAMLRRHNADTPMHPISRSDYDAISTKASTGRPNQYFVDRQYNRCVMYLWPIGENASDVVVYDRLRQVANVGLMGNTLQMPPEALDCFVTGLAMRLAEKFKRERYQELKLEYGGPRYPEVYGGKLFQMRAASGERAGAQFTYLRRRR